MNLLAGQTVVITGGSGSFGNAFVKRLLAMQPGPSRICILSRDELKQAEMRVRFNSDHRLRWFLGDVRDLPRLEMAFYGADVVIHGAALKRVDACEAEPREAYKTNVVGTANVIDAAIKNDVKRVVALSTDKAAAPVNTYGVSKAFLERLVCGSSVYSGRHATKFAVVRYGNVAGARGSVIPIWRSSIQAGQPLTLTEPDATRFWFTLDGAIDLVLWTLNEMYGGELVVPRLPSFRLLDLAEAVAPNWPKQMNGHRLGDKKHEVMVSADEAVYFKAYKDRMVRFLEGDARGEPLPEGFHFGSDNNTEWLDVHALRLELARI
jgi:UDP-N-acetylglucosamine 4,6-dehydratase/5-epimerase